MCCDKIFFKPLGGLDSFDICPGKNEPNKESGFYPGFQHHFVGPYVVEFGYVASKIDMLTCRSVQATRRRTHL